MPFAYAAEYPWRLYLPSDSLLETKYYSSPDNVCAQTASLALELKYPNGNFGVYSSVVFDSQYPSNTSGTQETCRYLGTRTFDGSTSYVFIDHHITRWVQCVAGSVNSFQFAGHVLNIGGVPTAIVNSPSSYCNAGCGYTAVSNTYNCSVVDSENSVCTVDYERNGSSCTTGEATDDGDTGGGDTGGGDTGGGDTGGGDTGGGDTGGGDTGGGDTGGSDTGGGDTGGGDTGGSNTGDYATGADVSGLGNRIVSAIDGMYSGLASAISGLRGSVDGLGDKLDELNGPDYGADGGLPGAEAAGSMGTELGEGLAGALSDAVGDALETRDGELQEELDGIADTVDGWFGKDGANIDKNNLLGFIPKSSGCSDIYIPVKFNKFDLSITIPACDLVNVKAILEWIFYALTLIGIWKILMSGMIVSARGGKR